MRRLLDLLRDALSCALGRHDPRPARLASGHLRHVCARCGLLLSALLVLAGCAPLAAETLPLAVPTASAPAATDTLTLAREVGQAGDVWRLSRGPQVVAVLVVLASGHGRLTLPREGGRADVLDLDPARTARAVRALVRVAQAGTLDAWPEPARPLFLTRTV